MSSLLDLNLASIIISDLNQEIKFKIGEHITAAFTENLLSLQSDGDNHSIIMLGNSIWDSKLEYQVEDIPIEKEMLLNERKPFEAHIRKLINDRINTLKHLEL